MTARVLVVSPHPDDESIGCGGTLRRLTSEGAEVRVVFLTSGEKGGHGRDEDEVRRTREAEAACAAEILGLSGIEFWREPDGALRARADLAERVARAIADRGATRLYVPHPADGHADHRAAARIVLAAARRLGASAPDVLGFEVWTPLARMDVVEDVSPWIDAKAAAIRAYASQCAALRFDEAAVALARWRGEMFCWPKPEASSGRHAEVFVRLRP